jgi:sugar lactone lactonase YvrE
VHLVAADPLLRGADGIAFDVKENLYVSVNFQDRISVVDKHGHVDTVAEGAPLDGPSSLAFGTGSDDETLYITNFAIGRALGIVAGTPHPGILSLHVHHPGLPLP